jgi:hypothetical protein
MGNYDDNEDYYIDIEGNTRYYDDDTPAFSDALILLGAALFC